MRILMVTNIYPNPNRPHLGSFVKSQIDSIEQEGVHVDVLFIDVKKSHLEYVKAAIWIMQASLQKKYDLIHAHYGFSGIVARCQIGTPVLVSFCGDDVLGTPDSMGRRLLSSMIWVALNQILTFFIPAAIVKSKEMKMKLIRRDNVIVVANGVDFNIFKPMDRERLRKKFNMNKDTRYILYASNPSEPRKCYPVIQQAAMRLSREGLPTEVFVFQNRPPEEVPLAMNACDALVLASYWEGSPNVVKESMACNLPVVAVDVGDVKDIIQDCEDCAIAGRNVRDIADKLKPILKKNKRTLGIEQIAHLEIHHVAQKIIRIYRSILTQ